HSQQSYALSTRERMEQETTFVCDVSETFRQAPAMQKRAGPTSTRIDSSRRSRGSRGGSTEGWFGGPGRRATRRAGIVRIGNEGRHHTPLSEGILSGLHGG